MLVVLVVLLVSIHWRGDCLQVLGAFWIYYGRFYDILTIWGDV